MRKRIISVRKHTRTRNSRIFPVRRHVRHIHSFSGNKHSYYNFQRILDDARKDNSLWAQPIRVQPTKEIMYIKEKDKYKYLTSLTLNAVNEWGTDSVFLDSKVRGIRAIIIYDYDTNSVQIFSRLGKRLYSLEERFGNQIRVDLQNDVNGTVMIDSEFYALRNNKSLHQADLNGFAHNSSDEKYADVKAEFRAFDILMDDGRDIRDLSLLERKSILEEKFDDDGIIKLAPTELLFLTKNKKRNEQLLLNRFQRSLNEGYEGLVIKDTHTPYYHRKGGSLHWFKMKPYETIDLRLKTVNAYPSVDSKKDFRFYKHWILVPSDRPSHEMYVDKGIRAAKLNNDYYINFTRDILNKIDKGELKASEQMVTVNPKFRSYYGREKVPVSVKMPIKDGRIIEVFMEDISKDLKGSGIKIIGERFDKNQADSMSEIKKIHEIFY